ncbi:MAG: hypothetical protein FJX35_13485 [Alphaproteobacteria bacterium]|nr:hypothetical protein [Alphaproteobacteria bacterium]
MGEFVEVGISLNGFIAGPTGGWAIRWAMAAFASGHVRRGRGLQQCIRAGWVDEMAIHLTQVLMGRGVRLLDRLADCDVKLESEDSRHPPPVTHLRYRVGSEAA